MNNIGLSEAALAQLPTGVARPGYDRSRLRKGVVHLGPGAFHRAHQAPAFDAILAQDPRWGIVDVSLHSAGVRDALAPQDGLYVLALLDEAVRFRVIGAVLEVLVAPEDPEAVLSRLAAPETEIVTLTITEKGYCLNAAGGLDLEHPDIRADLASPEKPKSAIGYLVEALARRRAAGLAPFAAISCDNLADNGVKLLSALATFASSRDDGLADWIKARVCAPRTMVDSITPASNDELRARVSAALGIADGWPIQREAFTQWVVEDLPGLPKLDWAGMGVTLTKDVSFYEHAKLRVLNASHSGLAYLGQLAGRRTVYEAMGDEPLADFVSAFMREDVAPSLAPGAAGFDVPGYCAAVEKRFRNPEIRHFLWQIAWDGSQKLPNRVFGLIEDALAAGRPLARPARIIAGWMVFVRRKAGDPQFGGGDTLVDPLAPALLACAGQCSGEAERDVGLFLELETVFPSRLAHSAMFRAALIEAYAELVNQA